MRTLFRILAGTALVLPVFLVAQGKQQASPLDDAAIVGIVEITNTWSMEAGSLAATRASRQDVKEFGAMLVTTHTVARDSIRALAAKLKLRLGPVPADFPLKVAHDSAVQRLKGLSGTAFDSAFLEHEAAYHAAVSEAVTKTYLPAIRSIELKTFLEKLAPTFVAHREAAEGLLKKK